VSRCPRTHGGRRRCPMTVGAHRRLFHGRHGRACRRCVCGLSGAAVRACVSSVRPRCGGTGRAGRGPGRGKRPERAATSVTPPCLTWLANAVTTHAEPPVPRQLAEEQSPCRIRATTCAASCCDGRAQIIRSALCECRTPTPQTSRERGYSRTSFWWKYLVRCFRGGD
jgi:hypothetical protein